MALSCFYDPAGLRWPAGILSGAPLQGRPQPPVPWDPAFHPAGSGTHVPRGVTEVTHKDTQRQPWISSSLAENAPF